MSVANMYRTATSYTAINVINLGNITNWATGDNGVCTLTSNLDIQRYSEGHDTPAATDLTRIDFNNESPVYLYANKNLNYGISLSDILPSYNNSYRYCSLVQNTTINGRCSVFFTANYPIYLARATVNGVEYLGFLCTTTRPNLASTWAFVSNTVYGAKLAEEMTYIGEIDADIDGLDGDGDYNFEGDNIELPGAPDESVSGVLASGFLNIYKPTDANLRAFGAALWTNAFNVKWSDIDSVSNLVLNAVSNPIDFIIGLFMLPITPAVGASSGIFLGGINVNTISAPRVSSQYVRLDFGTIDISELYGNYLDYANSRVSIYLPYVGTADIDVQEINGGSVHLQYIVDVFTGACVANVQCTKITKTPWGMSYANSTVHSYSGNMAIQLPISAGSFDTLTQGLINVGLGLGSNTPAIAMTGAKDVVQGFAGDVTTRGSLSSNTGKLGYQTPYLMFTRPIESRPANLGALHGYSAGVGGLLYQFSGYVVCSDVKLDGVTATDSELNEIESILKSGVYV